MTVRRIEPSPSTYFSALYWRHFSQAKVSNRLFSARAPRCVRIANTTQTQRSEIAHTAARLLAVGEADDFVGAKRKAAAALGLASFRNMPENLEVHKALILYLQLFEGDKFTRRIEAMRRAARTAMVLFAQFRPRLVGPVLYGSACEHSPITLHLYTDELESVTRFLHETQINYRLTQTVLKISRERREEFPMFLLANNGLEFNLVVLVELYNTHPPLSSLNGRPFKRADIDALDKLISETAASAQDDGLVADIGGS